MTLADLNATDGSGFAGALGSIFESSPWVAERAWAQKPFATLDALHDAMTAVVSAASSEEQLALLRAHPDLGAVRLTASAKATASLAEAPSARRRKPDTASTGRSVRLQADPQPLSDASQREQAGAGLDTLTREELDHFTKLNAAYREKFGFPFLYAVKGSTKRAILNALERRLLSTREAEYEEALRQVYRIARFRLEEAIS